MVKFSVKVQQAIKYAKQKHGNDFRKGSNIPYINHPLEALYIVSTITDDEDVLCAAVLHDVIEDAKVTAAELTELFGKRVADLVADESEDKRENLPPKDTWKIRKEESIAHLSHASKEAKIVALGDKLANIREIHKDYNDIGEKVWERFNCKDPAEQGWYYRSMLNALADLSYTEAWKEYKEHIEAVFGSEV